MDDSNLSCNVWRDIKIWSIGRQYHSRYLKRNLGVAMLKMT
jgi:hypothetical protein